MQDTLEEGENTVVDPPRTANGMTWASKEAAEKEQSIRFGRRSVKKHQQRSQQATRRRR